MLAMLAMFGWGASPAAAESAVRLPPPDTLGVVPAGTYDLQGRRLGDAHLVSERLDDGTLRILVETGIDGGARNVSMALLRLATDGRGLEPILETSQSFMADGRSLGVLRVDHTAGEASCTPPQRASDSMPDVAAGPGASTDEQGVQRLALPARDRVVNVPLNLLFQPLVRGDLSRVDFQIFLCRGGARLWDFSAEVSRRTASGSRKLVEVRYRPDLGPFLSMLAAPMMPQLAFWFAGDGSAAYLGHRFSLYTKGPEVVVAREGASKPILALTR
jgi:hypothetical protein